MRKIAFVRNGGQPGTERAALNAAKEHGVPITGWCPQGGLTEDYPNPPGITIKYPELQQTPQRDFAQSIEWNIRDSHATLIVAPIGTYSDVASKAIIHLAQLYERRVLLVSGKEDRRDLREWMSRLGYGIDLFLTGPRESERPGAYEFTKWVMSQIFENDRG